MGDVREDLWSVYEEHCAFAGVPVQDFTRELSEGTYGDFSKDDIVALLERLLAAVIENIDLMAESDPRVADMAEDRKEEQTAFYRELIAKVRG